jgi:hypothetical protein
LWTLCGFIVAVELALGAYMAMGQGFIYVDSISRLANAFYVLYSRDPHLAAIGLVWNPLPSLLSLPLLLLYPLFPSLASSGMFIVILTALFAGLTLLMVWEAFRQFSVRTGAAAVCLGLFFALHPFQLWYGANGMSEAIFGCFLAIAVVYWTRWLKTEAVKHMLVASIALGLAFLTRYEAVPFAAFLIIGTSVVLWNRRAPWRKLESTAVIFALPIAFAGCVWIWLNYTIMDDPLYFLTSSYSNHGQSELLADNAMISGIIGNSLGSFLYMLQRTGVFLIPYIAILAARYRITGTLRHADLLALTLLVWSIPLFQWFMLMNGSSYGWLRFFYYPMLVAFAWMPYEWSITPGFGLRRMKGFALGAFALSAVMAIPAMNNPAMAPEEYAAIHHRDSEMYISAVLQKRIAEHLDNEIFGKDPDSLVLTDSFNANRIILGSKYPHRFVNTTDRDFEIVLEDPYLHEVTHILVPPPGGVNDLNAVYARYPGFYEAKYGWAELDRTFEDGWRLFRVTAPSDFTK